MPGKKDPQDQWKQTSVVLRADIFMKASEMGLDISNECNQALAYLLGIDYQQQKLSDQTFTNPLIVSSETPSKGGEQTTPKPRARFLHPVINADDPTAIAKVLKAKRQPSQKSVPETQVRGDQPSAETSAPPQIPSIRSPLGKGKVITSEKKKREDSVKKFVSTKIVRTDAADAVITKDDMYQAFVRWCRDYRRAAVPERKAFATLLKNKFALTEKTINGNPCWVNVHLR